VGQKSPSEFDVVKPESVSFRNLGPFSAGNLDFDRQGEFPLSNIVPDTARILWQRVQAAEARCESLRVHGDCWHSAWKKLSIENKQLKLANASGGKRWAESTLEAHSVEMNELKQQSAAQAEKAARKFRETLESKDRALASAHAAIALMEAESKQRFDRVLRRSNLFVEGERARAENEAQRASEAEELFVSRLARADEIAQTRVLAERARLEVVTQRCERLESEVDELRQLCDALQQAAELARAGENVAQAELAAQKGNNAAQRRAFEKIIDTLERRNQELEIHFKESTAQQIQAEHRHEQSRQHMARTLGAASKFSVDAATQPTRTNAHATRDVGLLPKLIHETPVDLVAAGRLVAPVRRNVFGLSPDDTACTVSMGSRARKEANEAVQAAKLVHANGSSANAPVTIVCSFDCGFKGTFDVVVAHENVCLNRPLANTGAFDEGIPRVFPENEGRAREKERRT
jgi:hypothetical protein